jgi:hypothetical protein
MFQFIHSSSWRSLASVAAQTGGSSNTPYILQFRNRVLIPIPYQIRRFEAGKHIGQLFADATNPHKEVAHELCTRYNCFDFSMGLFCVFVIAQV